MSSITLYIHVRTTPDEPNPYVVGAWALRNGKTFIQSLLVQVDGACSHAQGCVMQFIAAISGVPVTAKEFDVVVPDSSVVTMLSGGREPKSRTMRRLVRQARALLASRTPHARLRAGRVYELETIAEDDDLWA
jgi:hypothetical protein